MFKIISVGWECAPWIERTLRSVRAQTRGDWEHYITYDPSTDNGAQVLFDQCQLDERISARVNGERKFAPRNQWEAIQRAQPADDDIVVFLDLDGDMLAHPEVLDHLAGYYSDDTLLTYGNYTPVPFAESCPPAIPFPPDVINMNSYRWYLRDGGPCSFNHLRTMSGAITNRITAGMLQWADGTWYEGGTDYVFMISGLEMAGPRHKCIEEVLLTYNNANPHADYLHHPEQTSRCVQDFLHRFPLNPI